MNMFKSNGGFTLVELIVVIAILAILAGVAVPVYSGYIKNANNSAVLTELEAIKTAAMAAEATAGEIGNITVTNATTLTIAGVDSEKFVDNFELFYGEGKATVTVNETTKVATVTLATAIKSWANTDYAANGATWSAADGWVATPANS